MLSIFPLHMLNCTPTIAPRFLSLLLLAVLVPIAVLHAQSNYATPYTFTTFAGASATGTVDGTGTAARFGDPEGVAVDSAGNVYVADYGNHTIRKINSAGVVITFAGTAGSSGSTDGTGSAARFSGPYGITVDGTGNIYVGDSTAIRKITLAGTVGLSGSINGTGSAAQFESPHGIGVDRAGNVYVADAYTSRIRKVTPAGVVTTLAGGDGMGITMVRVQLHYSLIPKM